jgi:hypothetical protein
MTFPSKNGVLAEVTSKTDMTDVPILEFVD